MNAKLPGKHQFETGTSPVHRQYGALCYRIDNGKLQFLLVTSRDTGRWIIPKGWPEGEADPASCASREAWEEAGVIGTSNPKSLGKFSYLKRRPSKGNIVCLVEVFLIRVRKLASDYPEAGQRRRKWFSRKKAAQRASDPGLAEILREFRPRL